MIEKERQKLRWWVCVLHHYLPTIVRVSLPWHTPVPKASSKYPTRCGRLLPFHSNWDTQVRFVLQVQSTSFNAKSDVCHLLLLAISIWLIKCSSRFKGVLGTSRWSIYTTSESAR
ncbi:hypothetical protein Hdeb2414_s0019g00542481 [Helianthus debilis subsp. tardiflorus]